MKVYLLIEITDYDCTDEEVILNIFSSEKKATEEKVKLTDIENERIKNKTRRERYPYNFFYEIREYEVIE